MSSLAVFFLTVLIAGTLVLLAQQQVSSFMGLGLAVSLLTVFTATVVLLAWQGVSDSMSCLVASPLIVSESVGLTASE